MHDKTIPLPLTDKTKQSSIPQESVMFFDHETMFNKCQICKIFEIKSPVQSGDSLHYHDYSQIWYVTRGYCEHVVEGQKYNMLVGDAFLLPPRVTHSTTLKENSSIICCEFYMNELFPSKAMSYDKMREITQNISFTMLFQSELFTTQPKFTLSRKGQQNVEKLMFTMLDEYTNCETYYEDFLYLQIIELLLTFAREYTQSPVHEISEKAFDKYSKMVEMSIQYINEHYHEPLTLDSVCKISMVSKTYFCYLFKLLTNQTFIEYLTNLRINKAMDLLHQTNLPVTEIGHSVGFRDSTHFSRTFRQIRGISPREYRRSVKSN